jgi:signal transduction histidine kinase
MAGALAVAFLNVFGYQGLLSAILFDWNVKISSVVALGLAIIATRKKQTPYAWSFLIGFGIYMIGGNIWTLQFRSQIPATGVNRYALFWAHIIENIIFTFAVMREARKQLHRISSVEAKQQYGERMAIFVKVLTHDLSNYIGIIEGSIRAMLRSNLDSNQRLKMSERALKAIEHQKEVLESVKALKAVEDGKAELKLSMVDLRKLLPDLLVVFETKLAAKKIKIQMQYPTDSAVFVIADRATLFHSVLCNLVSNAIKFSESGSEIKIVVEQGIEMTSIAIIDRGLGIPLDLQSRLFSSSEKTSRVGTEGEKGTGFGLPIVHAYMNLYGGSIEVESKCKEVHSNDHGTRFTLKFQGAMIA